MSNKPEYEDKINDAIGVAASHERAVEKVCVIIEEFYRKGFKSIMPEIKITPNPLKADMVHNSVERKRMNFNEGWNECRNQILENIKKIL